MSPAPRVHISAYNTLVVCAGQSSCTFGGAVARRAWRRRVLCHIDA
ncbi:MAG: hypothetical protein OJF49_001828 [Ktedonobacterales bacterium]|nr:MAG: hypothetical protein OJF49_001828 [Ktedonobacterales bacterium]